MFGSFIRHAGKAFGHFGGGVKRFGHYVAKAANHAAGVAGPAANLVGAILDRAGHHGAAQSAGRIGERVRQGAGTVANVAGAAGMLGAVAQAKFGR
jgi:hypothetical protein